MRHLAAINKSDQAALLSRERVRPKCDHCGKQGHLEAKCWKKYPHLNPHKKKADSAAIVIEKEDSEPVICLMADHDRSCPNTKSREWHIDSACTSHMTYDRSAFSTFTPEETSPVLVGNLGFLKVKGHGKVKFKLLGKGKPRTCFAKDVLYVPDLGFQLLSVPTLARNGFTVSFLQNFCLIKKKSELIAKGTMINNLYRLDVCSDDKAFVRPNVRQAAMIADLSLWHKRLAHVDSLLIRKMCEKKTAIGLEIKKTDFLCNGCIYGKGHRSPIPKKRSTNTNSVLQLIHSDVNGPFEVPSMGVSRYFITFIDDYSKWITVYPMKQKSEGLVCFKKFHKHVKDVL